MFAVTKTDSRKRALVAVSLSSLIIRREKTSTDTLTNNKPVDVVTAQFSSVILDKERTKCQHNGKVMMGWIHS